MHILLDTDGMDAVYNGGATCDSHVCVGSVPPCVSVYMGSMPPWVSANDLPSHFAKNSFLITILSDSGTHAASLGPAKPPPHRIAPTIRWGGGGG